MSQENVYTAEFLMSANGIISVDRQAKARYCVEKQYEANVIIPKGKVLFFANAHSQPFAFKYMMTKYKKNLITTDYFDKSILVPGMDYISNANRQEGNRLCLLAINGDYTVFPEKGYFYRRLRIYNEPVNQTNLRENKWTRVTVLPDENNTKTNAAMIPLVFKGKFETGVALNTYPEEGPDLLLRDGNSGQFKIIPMVTFVQQYNLAKNGWAQAIKAAKQNPAYTIQAETPQINNNAGNKVSVVRYVGNVRTPLASYDKVEMAINHMVMASYGYALSEGLNISIHLQNQPNAIIVAALERAGFEYGSNYISYKGTKFVIE